MPQSSRFAMLPQACMACICLLSVTVSLAHAATFTVTTENNGGAGSLREAIESANSSPGADTIDFDAAVTRILIATPLPALNDASGGTTIDGGGDVTISGENLISLSPGLHLVSDGNTVLQIRIVHFSGAGIRVAGNDCTLRGCRLGFENGLPAPNHYGVLIVGTGALLGGPSPDHGNVIAGNEAHGVYLAVPDNFDADAVLRNNYIGTNPSGNTGIGNSGHGVYVENCRDIHIGRYNVGNIISGNAGDGVHITGSNARDVRLRKNLIGLTPNGDAALPNEGNGVQLDNADAVFVGGPVATHRNIISGNAGAGVLVINGTANVEISGNLIGLSEDGVDEVPNSEEGVRIESCYDIAIGVPGDDHLQVISGNDGAGVLLTGTFATANLIQNNYIGLDVNGMSDVSNQGGVRVEAGASGNIIGGAVAGEGNVISGNVVAGIQFLDVETVNNLVQGNIIGADPTGLAFVTARSDGIVCSGAGTNVIGGAVANGRNVISGNIDGIVVDDGAAPQIIAGNYIGVGIDGQTRVRNTGSGVYLEGVIGTVVGSTDPLGRNVISGNELHGVALGPEADENVVVGNYIGLAADGQTAQPNLSAGIYLQRADRNVIGNAQPGGANVISGNGGYGVQIFTANLNLVYGNFIGTAVDGSTAAGNGDAGVYVFGSNNEVGSQEIGTGNVISGNNGAGVYIADGQSTKIHANIIGLNADGNAALGNTGAGVHSGPSTINTDVGNNLAGTGNVISGNGSHGVHFEEVARIGVKFSLVSQNIIGLGADGMTPLGNGGDGVRVENCTDVTVGGERGIIFPGQDCAGNVIGDNGGHGILVLGGTGHRITRNIIGTDVTRMQDVGNTGAGIQVEDGATDLLIGFEPVLGTEEERNLITNNLAGIKVIDSITEAIRIRGNGIFDNNNDGILLQLGANGGVAAPTISALDPVTGTAPADSTVELFVDDAAEGRRLIDSVNADGSGNFTKSVDLAPFGGKNLTATATDEDDNTSAFSLPFAIPGQPEGEPEGEGNPEGESDSCGDGLISGIVTDSETSNPIDLARVALIDQDETEVGFRNTTFEGYYLFSPAPAGDYTLVATKEGYLDFTMPVTIASGLGTPGSFAMDPDPDFVSEGEGEPTGTLSLLLRDALTKLPIEGAGVTISVDGLYFDSGATDATGTIDFGVVPAVRFHFDVTADGYEPTQFDIRVLPDQDTGVIFDLSLLAEGEGGEEGEGEGDAAPGSLGGVVQDAEDASPVEGATVRLAQGGQTIDTAETNATGVYTFTDLPPGNYDVTAEAAGFETAAKAGTVTSGGAASVNFSLLPLSAEGEGEAAAEGEGVAEGGSEGMNEGEGAMPVLHSADTDNNEQFSLSEVLRVIQLYNAGAFQCDLGTPVPGEDGYLPGPGSTLCAPHSSDYSDQNWRIELSELLRLIQFFTAGTYYPCPAGEDDYCPGVARR